MQEFVKCEGDGAAVHGRVVVQSTVVGNVRSDRECHRLVLQRRTAKILPRFLLASLTPHKPIYLMSISVGAGTFFVPDLRVCQFVTQASKAICIMCQLHFFVSKEKKSVPVVSSLKYLGVVIDRKLDLQENWFRLAY